MFYFSKTKRKLKTLKCRIESSKLCSVDGLVFLTCETNIYKSHVDTRVTQTRTNTHTPFFCVNFYLFSSLTVFYPNLSIYISEPLSSFVCLCLSPSIYYMSTSKYMPIFIHQCPYLPVSINVYPSISISVPSTSVHACLNNCLAELNMYNWYLVSGPLDTMFYLRREGLEGTIGNLLFRGITLEWDMQSFHNMFFLHPVYLSTMYQHT